MKTNISYTESKGCLYQITITLLIITILLL